VSFVEFRSGLRSLFARYSLCSSPSPLPFSVSLSPTLLLRSYLFARYVARYAFFLLFLDDKAFREMFFKELYRQLFFLLWSKLSFPYESRARAAFFILSKFQCATSSPQRTSSLSRDKLSQTIKINRRNCSLFFSSFFKLDV